uniref:Thymidine kinase n=1 Tax=Human herpesvirus 2 TaxID=10310 RepID=A0A110B8A4_HHV2|nr:thymidine kinase [Human alphaherpesvirus 2]
MASHAGQQHAPAFGQAARASGPTDGRAASRPSHRQGASEARGDPELPTLLRVYIDGPHGVGKTTTSAQLMEALGPRDNIVYVPEPMTYWQVLGASETLTNIYNTQHRLDRGEISAGEAAVVMTSAQITMSTPYAATDAVLAPHIGGEAVGPQAPPPALTLVFDRHPIASLLCYPAARYLMGSMTPQAVLAFVALMPPTAPGTNLVLGVLPEAEHADRLARRQRPGERLDLAMLSAIRRVYDLLANTVRYLQRGGRWREDWGRLTGVAAATPDPAPRPRGRRGVSAPHRGHAVCPVPRSRAAGPQRGLVPHFCLGLGRLGRPPPSDASICPGLRSVARRVSRRPVAPHRRDDPNPRHNRRVHRRDTRPGAHVCPRGGGSLVQTRKPERKASRR